MSLDDYEPVAVRLDRWFKAETEAGHIPRITTSLLSTPGADICVFRAELWRIVVLADGAGDRSILLASGHAEEIRGQGNVNRTSHVENCETSAIGRALANWNQISHHTLGGRPSREEMQKTTTSNGSWKDKRDADRIEMGNIKVEFDTRLHAPLSGPASEKQIGYIMGACKRDGIVPPAWVKTLSKNDASLFIDAHKNGEPISAILQHFGTDEEPF